MSAEFVEVETAARERGVVLGNAKQAMANKNESRGPRWLLRPILVELSHRSARAIATNLNSRSVPTLRGGHWSAKTVLR